MSPHPFLKYLQDGGWTAVTTRDTPTPREGFQVPTAPAGDEQAARYATRALERECLDVATSPKGTRNHNLNRAAFSIGQLVSAGHLNAETAVQYLTQAAKDCGLDVPEINATIPRSLADGGEHPRQVELAPTNGQVQPAYSLDPTHAGGSHPGGSHPGNQQDSQEDEDGDGGGGESLFDRMVRAEYNQLVVRDEARRKLDAEKAGDTLAGIPAPTSLTDFLSVPDTDAEYSVDQLLPVGGRAILAAQYKAGKTTFVANLLRALADGGKFLTQFDCGQPRHVALLDDELDERLLRRWLREQGVHNTDHVSVYPLKGRVSSFNILDDRVRGQWARQLEGTDFLILDCLRPVLDGAGLDENHDVGQFLNAFDALTEQAGIDEQVVVHHMGHGAQRSRGDSRILDWPDATWKITRADTDDPASRRFFSAFGRDVNVPEGALSFDEAVKRLSFTGASKRASRAWQMMPDLIRVLDRSVDAMSGRAIETAMTGHFGHPQKATREVAKLAVEERVVWTQRGTDRSTLHSLNRSHPEVVSTLVSGAL